MMREPIKQRRGLLGITEDVGPFGKVQVGVDDHAGVLVPTRHAVEGVIFDARNDVEAAVHWLKAKGTQSTNTFESYRREAVRLLLWLGEQCLSLAEVKVEHAHLYFAHLACPPKHWIRPCKKPSRNQILFPTQILTGPLSSKSIDYTRTVLVQMCAYLQSVGYIRHNVFKLSTKPTFVVEITPTRFLNLETWNWLWDWLCALPCGKPAEAPHASRARWLFALLYHTGLRRQETAQGRMEDFIRENGEWFLQVIGKGKRNRSVSINSTLLTELVRYRRSLDLPDYPSPDEDLPLVLSIKSSKTERRSKPLTPRAISLLVHSVAKQAQMKCPDKHICTQIQQMTTHWMRHTNATHRLMLGASLLTTQDELGHADPKTTHAYARAGTRVSAKKRSDDAELLVRPDRD
jgi:site-specific recombinase XerD